MEKSGEFPEVRSQILKTSTKLVSSILKLARLKRMHLVILRTYHHLRLILGEYKNFKKVVLQRLQEIGVGNVRMSPHDKTLPIQKQPGSSHCPTHEPNNRNKIQNILIITEKKRY
jgi:hypothetical protein